MRTISRRDAKFHSVNTVCPRQVVAANNAGTCYVWRMMRGATASTHFEPLHKLKAHSRAWCLMYSDLVAVLFATMASFSTVPARLFAKAIPQGQSLLVAGLLHEL